MDWPFPELTRLTAVSMADSAADGFSMDHPSAINGLAAFSGIVLLRPGTLTSNRHLLGKADSTLTLGWRLRVSGTAGNMELQLKGSSNGSFITSGGLRANNWVWIAFTVDTTVSPNVHIYTCVRGGALRERTYGTSTDVTSYVNDGTKDLLLGSVGGLNALVCTHAFFGYFAGAMTLPFLDAVRDAVDFQPFGPLPPALVYAVPNANGKCRNGAVPGAAILTGVTSATKNANPPGAWSRPQPWRPYRTPVAGVVGSAFESAVFSSPIFGAAA